MILNGYLIITPKNTGSNYYPRMSADMRVAKTKPSLKAKEIAFKLEITLPDTLWNRPITEIKLDVPQDILVNPDAAAVVSMVSPEIADALKVDVKDIEDGLLTALKNRKDQEDDKQS